MTHLLLSCLLLFLPANTPRQEIELGYQRIANAFQSKSVEALLKENFRWRNDDGSFPSSREVKRVWSTNLSAIKKYSAVQFQVTQVNLQKDRATVTATRTMFFLYQGADEEQIEVVKVRDLWIRDKKRWHLDYTSTLPNSTTGVVLAEPSGIPESPTLASLVRSLRNGHSNAVREFWKKVQGKSPLVEPIPNEGSLRLVTYLWRGDKVTKEVKLRGGLPSELAKAFQLLVGTDIWYHSERLPSNARFAYSLWVTKKTNRPSKPNGTAESVLATLYPPDPLNPKVFNDAPLLELPDAPLQPYLQRNPVTPVGSVVKEVVTSRVLKEEREVSVYLPESYERDRKHCRLLILFDGEDYKQLIPTPTILDNLISQGKIPSTIALLVHSQGTRFRDLRCSDAFSEFVVTELLGWARNRYRIRDGPENVIVGGLSLGGLMAAYCGLRHSDVIGSVISQSGAFWHSAPKGLQESDSIGEDGWITRQFAKSERVPVRFWLEVGRLESNGMIQNNRRLRDVLKAKGHEVNYSEFTGGHDYLSWRGTLADALIWMLKE